MTWPRYGYLLILIISLSGCVFLDYRRRVALWVAPRRSLLTLLVSVSIFTLWDACGIALKIFYTNPRYVVGIGFMNYPLEELLLLTLISYITLLGLKWQGRTA